MQKSSSSFSGAVFASALILTASIAVSAEPTPEELEKIRAAVPDQATVQPNSQRHLLVFSRAWGYKHTAIPYGKAMIQAIASKTEALKVTFADDLTVFEKGHLDSFDAVLFNNTNNEIFLPENFSELSPSAKKEALARDARLKENLVRFLSGGNGLAVIHAGVASFREWPEFGTIMGARFENHPWNAGSTISLNIEDPDHSLCQAFSSSRFEVTDEIYQFKEWDRNQLRVLFSIDTSGIDLTNKTGIRRKDGDFALSWIKKYGKGRVFYSALGHQHDIFWNKILVQHFLDGIQFALGDLPASTTPLPKSED